MDKKPRTWICSVLFMDIVSYTKFSVEEQMEVREHYYTLVNEILNNYSQDDYITIDAGDGMAVCYTGDPEDILLMAMSLRDAFVNLKKSGDICYEVRHGINLGPVKIVELQGVKRVIGDAINVASRIMGFAEGNQLLVSRSYFDVVINVSREYMKMFNYLGLHEDKHVRKHALYAVSPDGNSTDEKDPEVTQPKFTTVTFEDEILHQIEIALANHIGPLARILVKKYSAKAKDIAELYHILAQEIHTEEQRQQFLDTCALYTNSLTP